MAKLIKYIFVTVSLFNVFLLLNPFSPLPVSRKIPSLYESLLPEDKMSTDQIGWVYRIHDGWIQGRRWNYTKDHWADSLWHNFKKVPRQI